MEKDKNRGFALIEIIIAVIRTLKRMALSKLTILKYIIAKRPPGLFQKVPFMKIIREM